MMRTILLSCLVLMNIILLLSFFHRYNCNAYRYLYYNNYKSCNYEEKLSTFQTNKLLLSSLQDISFVDDNDEDADDDIISLIFNNERRTKQLVNNNNNNENNNNNNNNNNNFSCDNISDHTYTNSSSSSISFEGDSEGGMTFVDYTINSSRDEKEKMIDNIQSLMKDERIEYQKGKIYQIRCKITNKIYIGSTCKTLAQRISTHKSQYKRYKNGKYLKNYSSFEVMEKNDYVIELIEDYPCSSKVQLFTRERYWTINTVNCVNIIRNQGLFLELGRKKVYDNYYYKEYYEKNVDTLKAKMKEYRDKNVDIIKTKNKEYYDKNVDTINAKRNVDTFKTKKKEYRVKNVDKIKAQNKEYYDKNVDKINKQFICPCGGKYTYCHKSRHLKSEKHLKWEVIKSSRIS